jgi:hypothetical protein
MDVVAVMTNTTGLGFLPIVESHQHLSRFKNSKIGRIRGKEGLAAPELMSATTKGARAKASIHRLRAIHMAAKASQHPQAPLAAKPVLPHHQTRAAALRSRAPTEAALT